MILNNKLFLVVFGFTFLLGCSNFNKQPGIIDGDTFVDVLADIHMADATIVVKGYRITSDSTLIRLLYNDVLQKHNVTQVQVLNTFKYYTKNPKKFEKLYDRVSERIVKREEEFEENTDIELLEDSLPKKRKTHRTFEE